MAMVENVVVCYEMKGSHDRSGLQNGLRGSPFQNLLVDEGSSLSLSNPVFDFKIEVESLLL